MAVFKLMTPEVLMRLKKNKKIKMPRKKVNVPKDERWNEKQMSSKIMHGIENGDSVDDIAIALMEVVRNNQASAIRNARTMVTAAENGGRLDSYRALDDEGVVQKKVWMATPDDRTRPSHIDIDGEEQDIDEPFSNGCMFPGDGDGPSEEVWCCRCSMRDHIVGFRRRDGSISKVNYGRDDSTHDRQMREEVARREKENDRNH